ncbi:MAG: acetate/propionate family kinase [Rhodospirillaceae bacterium]|nr:acetate/propionate family kinase [Rhodospirillaceae bacterium]MBL6930913.1 acetate/propionate family kinase [Rhodospirillales bacterium]MBL6941002.1 acetate/propionate family kinase [Rhodospirillales bacterium]
MKTTGENILVVNAGSSSVKFALFSLDRGEPVAILKGQVSGIGATPAIEARDEGGMAIPFAQPSGGIANHDDAFEALIGWLEERGESVAGAAHRVVHGGAAFTAPIRIDDNALEALDALTPLAPHHQPYNLAAIRALAARLPKLPQAACFDTAFHASQPAEARELGLPAVYAQRGIRRYGFHGLSYQSVAAALPVITGEALPRRLVIAHLGNGASMCALKDGACVATTMGFSTLDGIPMGTRSGSVDPGVLLHLMREDGAGLSELEDLLYNRSGLMGISGISQDMRTLLESDDPRAEAAVTFFCYRISRELGSLAAALGGLDALVFTGGIGENAAAVRAQVLRQAGWLGLTIDEDANNSAGPCISTAANRAQAWIVATQEELTIATHARAILDL